MYTLHCTKKLLDRIKPAMSTTAAPPTTALGNWYATAIFWKPQVALFVNERTLLPVVMPLAPAATLAARFPAALVTVLQAHGIDAPIIEAEIAAMADVSLAKTANRSVLGTMNEFSFMADHFRDPSEPHPLLALSMRLADIPCGSIKYDFPSRLLREVLRNASH